MGNPSSSLSRLRSKISAPGATRKVSASSRSAARVSFERTCAEAVNPRSAPSSVKLRYVFGGSLRSPPVNESPATHPRLDQAILIELLERTTNRRPAHRQTLGQITLRRKSTTARQNPPLDLVAKDPIYAVMQEVARAVAGRGCEELRLRHRSTSILANVRTSFTTASDNDWLSVHAQRPVPASAPDMASQRQRMRFCKRSTPGAFRGLSRCHGTEYHLRTETSQRTWSWLSPSGLDGTVPAWNQSSGMKRAAYPKRSRRLSTAGRASMLCWRLCPAVESAVS